MVPDVGLLACAHMYGVQTSVWASHLSMYPLRRAVELAKEEMRLKNEQMEQDKKAQQGQFISAWTNADSQQQQQTSNRSASPSPPPEPTQHPSSYAMPYSQPKYVSGQAFPPQSPRPGPDPSFDPRSPNRPLNPRLASGANVVSCPVAQTSPRQNQHQGATPRSQPPLARSPHAVAAAERQQQQQMQQQRSPPKQQHQQYQATPSPPQQQPQLQQGSTPSPPPPQRSPPGQYAVPDSGR